MSIVAVRWTAEAIPIVPIIAVRLYPQTLPERKDDEVRQDKESHKAQQSVRHRINSLEAKLTSLVASARTI
jgi:hypothetical protein